MKLMLVRFGDREIARARVGARSPKAIVFIIYEFNPMRFYYTYVSYH